MGADQERERIGMHRNRGPRDEVDAFLEGDPRWSDLPLEFRSTVSITSGQMVQWPFADVLKAAMDLDKNDEESGYWMLKMQTQL